VDLLMEAEDHKDNGSLSSLRWNGEGEIFRDVT